MTPSAQHPCSEARSITADDDSSSRLQHRTDCEVAAVLDSLSEMHETLCLQAY